MKGYLYSVNRDLASFSFINDTEEKRPMYDKKWSHYPIMNRLLNFMKARGFEVGRDPRIEKDYKCLNKDHWYGRKGDLEFKAERYPRGFRIEFFQNIVVINQNGGCYDFDKFEKMPYMVKLIWINETNKMAEFIETLGVGNNSKIEYKLAEDKVKFHLVDSWHNPQNNMDFNLNELDGTTCEGSYNNTDRDKKTIYNGEVKYFRNYHGRLQRGKVYHNINNMWWVILNDTEYTNEADFNLFDATVQDFMDRRIVRDRKPKEYIEKLKNIDTLSNKDLIREIKKRKIKIS